MSFDQSFLDEVTARNDIVDVVSQYVQLKKNGRNYMGLCPFHNEKTPSFSVVPDQQFFHCFGCGVGGSVISFLMKAEGLEFQDAVRVLADKAGLKVPEQGEEDRRAARRRERLLALCKEAARFFYDTLWLPENSAVQQYFAGRGLHRRTMNRFGLGYAPDAWNALMDAMTAKGYTRDELLEAGLIVRNEKGHYYDKFRNRVMFPIIDLRGNVIAFGGRVMDDSKPKYLNSPETTIFHKGRNLFAMNIAKTSDSDYFILAEGYMDVIALHQAGFDCAVASLGTSLTEDQAHMMSRLKQQIVISYDADGAGQAAAQRAIDILKKCDMSVRVLKIPGAKDPDEFIKANGADAFHSIIDKSENDSTYRLMQIAARHDLEDDADRIEFLRETARMLAGLDSAIERDVYTGKAAQMAKVTTEAMTAEVKHELAIRTKKMKSVQRREVRSPVSMVQPKDRALQYQDIKSARAEESVLRAAFADQALLSGLAEKLPPEWFSSPLLQKIYRKMLELNEQGNIIGIVAFEGMLSESEMGHLAGILEQPLRLSEVKQILQDCIATIHAQRMRDGTLQQTDEDPLLTLGKIKKQQSGGQ